MPCLLNPNPDPNPNLSMSLTLTLTLTRYMYDEIVARLATGKPEVDVLNELQERLGALTLPPRGGRGRERSKVNWCALVEELKAARPRPKPTRTGEAESEAEAEE